MKLLATAAVLALLALLGLAGGASAGDLDYVGKLSPTKRCQVERRDNPAAFKQKYGDRRGRHALRRCVRAKIRAANAACRAERRARPKAFRVKYGKGRHHRNAFKRCVRRRSYANA